jgi:biotin carboxyl carrier protein
VVRRYKVTVDGETYDVVVEDAGPQDRPVAKHEEPAARSVQPAPRRAPADEAAAAEAAAPAPRAASAGVDGGQVTSPLPGKVIAVKVQPGVKVKRGDLLFVIEAMKMENELFAGEAGTVRKVHVSAGQNVETGDLLVELTPGG